jgi:hypothetical protein
MYLNRYGVRKPDDSSQSEFSARPTSNLVVRGGWQIVSTI